MISSIASYSMATAHQSVHQDVGSALMGEALDTLEAKGAGLIEMIDEVAEMYEHLGNYVNTKA